MSVCVVVCLVVVTILLLFFFLGGGGGVILRWRVLTMQRVKPLPPGIIIDSERPGLAIILSGFPVYPSEAACLVTIGGSLHERGLALVCHIIRGRVVVFDQELLRFVAFAGFRGTRLDLRVSSTSLFGTSKSGDRFNGNHQPTANFQGAIQ